MLGTWQVLGRHYRSHEVPPGWFQGRNTRSLVHSNQPVESKQVTCQPATWQPVDYICPFFFPRSQVLLTAANAKSLRHKKASRD